MQQSCTYGSVRGASGNRRPYRDKTLSACDFLRFGFALMICAEMIVKSRRCFCMDRWKNGYRRSIHCGR
jgi:hypothetical protein